MLLEKLNAYWQWANEDQRVAGICPVSTTRYPPLLVPLLVVYTSDLLLRVPSRAFLTDCL